jgi:hypothetical protein
MSPGTNDSSQAWRGARLLIVLIVVLVLDLVLVDRLCVLK